jgi:hypothetical protein
MNKKLLASLAAVGLLAAGGSATALAATGTPAAAASTAAVVSSTSRMPNCGPLESLVTKGTITQAQAIAIHNAFVSYLHDHWLTMLDTVLGQLVRNHTITQAQARAVTTEISQWTQKYRGSGSGNNGPCQHNHGMGMMGGSGNR